jgi:hypothetical protein
MMMMMFMLVGWDYVSELRHQRAYCSYCRWENHGRLKSTEKNYWFIHQSSLQIIPTESSGRKQEERAKVVMNLALGSICVYTCKRLFLHVTFYEMFSPALLPLRRKSCCGFLSPFAWSGFEPANFGSTIKYAIPYTTKSTNIRYIFVEMCKQNHTVMLYVGTTRL